jgi:hypothetical protein
VAEWELFHRLLSRGDLRVRTFLFPGVGHWPEFPGWRAELRTATDAKVAPHRPGQTDGG